MAVGTDFSGGCALSRLRFALSLQLLFSDIHMAAITLSGFNGIDFNSILNAVMEYESRPLKAIQAEQTKIQNKDSAFVSLAGMITALQTQVTSLMSTTAFSKVAA